MHTATQNQTNVNQTSLNYDKATDFDFALDQNAHNILNSMCNGKPVQFEYNRESARIVAKIRHNETAYDKLVDFYYALDKKYREDLNRLCDEKRCGKLSDEEFNTKVDELQAQVNLFKKPNQRRFIKERQAQIAYENPDMSMTACKQMAHNELFGLLTMQSNRRRKNVGTHIPRHWYEDDDADFIDYEIDE